MVNDDLMMVNNGWLVVEPYPSEKWWSEFVSWDDDSIPNMNGENFISHVPVTTNQYIILLQDFLGRYLFTFWGIDHFGPLILRNFRHLHVDQGFSSKPIFLFLVKRWTTFKYTFSLVVDGQIPLSISLACTAVKPTKMIEMIDNRPEVQYTIAISIYTIHYYKHL